MEWQSDFAAGELIQPADKITWILDDKQPGEIVNLELYEKNYREYFGANRMMMETRLKALGYKLLNAKYEWADYAAEQKKQAEVSQKQRKATEKLKQMRRELDDIFGGFPAFDVSSIDFSSVFNEKTGALRRGWKSIVDRKVKGAMWEASKKG